MLNKPFHKLNKNFENIIDLNHNLFKKIQNLETIIKQKENSYFISNSDVTTNNNNNVAINKINSLNEEFDEKLNQKYKENQHHFCQSNDLFTDIEIENKISKVHAHLNNISFYMFVYKSGDYVSGSISGSGSWERYFRYAGSGNPSWKTWATGGNCGDCSSSGISNLHNRAGVFCGRRFYHLNLANAVLM